MPRDPIKCAFSMPAGLQHADVTYAQPGCGLQLHV